MKDKDQQLLWEAYIDKQGNFRGGDDPDKKPEEGGAKDSALNPDKRSSRKSNDPNERARAREYATRGQGAEGERQRKKMEAEDEPKEEGAFGGPGGNPDKEGWGEETSDAYTDEDIDGRIREVRSQLDTLVKWIDEGHRPEGNDIEDSFNDLHQLGQAINSFVMKHDVESIHPDPIERDDDYRGEDLPPRETDQDRYGYPGDR